MVLQRRMVPMIKYVVVEQQCFSLGTKRLRTQRCGALVTSKNVLSCDESALRCTPPEHESSSEVHSLDLIRRRWGRGRERTR